MGSGARCRLPAPTASSAETACTHTPLSLGGRVASRLKPRPLPHVGPSSPRVISHTTIPSASASTSMMLSARPRSSSRRSVRSPRSPWPTERLQAAGIKPSTGAVGSSHDNARRVGGRAAQDRADQGPEPLARLRRVEIATAEWVDWYSHRRAFEYCDDLIPVEAEQAHYAHHQTLQQREPSNQGLRTRRGGSIRSDGRAAALGPVAGTSSGWEHDGQILSERRCRTVVVFSVMRYWEGPRPRVRLLGGRHG
jgi:hypothetical protein